MKGAGRPLGRVATLRPLPGAPALRLDPGGADGARRLVIADLHLGLGAPAGAPAGPPEASARSLSDEVVRLARLAHARTVLIAGDVKHPIVGTPRALRPVVFDFFASLLDRGLRPEVVLGNHDVGLVPCLPTEVVVHPASGALLGDVGVFHGHRWPSNALLGARTLVAGHLHPGFRFAPTADAPSGKVRCWVRATLPPPRASSRRRRRHAPLRAREIVVLPAFNPLAGTEALNRERPARGRSFLFGRFLGRGEARAYLLDGTDVGPIVTPAGTTPPSAGARRAARAR